MFARGEFLAILFSEEPYSRRLYVPRHKNAMNYASYHV